MDHTFLYNKASEVNKFFHSYLDIFYTIYMSFVRNRRAIHFHHFSCSSFFASPVYSRQWRMSRPAQDQQKYLTAMIETIQRKWVLTCRQAKWTQLVLRWPSVDVSIYWRHCLVLPVLPLQLTTYVRSMLQLWYASDPQLCPCLKYIHFARLLVFMVYSVLGHNAL
jgi:hypothetical protein